MNTNQQQQQRPVIVPHAGGLQVIPRPSCICGAVEGTWISLRISGTDQQFTAYCASMLRYQQTKRGAAGLYDRFDGGAPLRHLRRSR